MWTGMDIVVPVYNEGGNIGRLLAEITGKVRTPHRIIIVYDFDQDNTLPAARQAAQELGLDLHFLKNDLGRGVLNAIKAGLRFADAELVLVTMADLSDPAEVFDQLVDHADATGADIVCASRYMKGGRQVGGPLLKRTLSRLAGLSLHYGAGLPTHDATNSFKLYRRRVLEAIPIESSGGFELGMELVIKAHFQGFKVSEVPTCWYDRADGQSRFQLFKWLPNYLKWYGLALRWRWLG